jgi:pantetheine-phosphate adenylyltransferase
MKPKKAVFPGSFDPFTLGHFDIVSRGLNIFDEIIIGIGKNSTKQRYFELDFMIDKIQSVFKDQPQVKVKSFEGLTADFAKANDAQYLIRGLRNTTDFEYENTIAQANKHIWNELETVFLITQPEYASISSTLIRDIHKYQKDVNKFLPYKLYFF